MRKDVGVLGFLLLLAPPASAQDVAGLGAARRLLADPWEPNVRRGAEICARANDAEAVGLLLTVLRRRERLPTHALSAAHYRDIVWDGLVAITDPYARRAVARELRENRRDARVRQWCAELLGIYGDGDLAPALLEALEDPDADVRRFAAQALGRMRLDRAVEPLRRLAQAKHAYLRADAIEALARIAPARFKGRLVEGALTDADGGVRCALLGALAALFEGEIVRVSAMSLRDADWRPRLQAVENLGRVKTKPAVDALVEAAADGRPVVAAAAGETLRRLTGREISDAAAWRGWWAENRATFVFPEREGEARGTDRERRTVAYGIPLASDHVGFMIDKSLRMRDPLASAKTTKDKAAAKELRRILRTLRGRLTFNVHLYRETVHAFSDEPSPCDYATMRRALAFTGKYRPKGAKNIWKVLETVVADPRLDTAYLLSSGEPDVGLYVHWNRVTRYLRDLNRFHKTTVHTVVYSDDAWYREQLAKIAEATGGRFRAFE